MQITVSKYAGYCYGVKTAIDMAKKSIEENEKIYCLGYIIHNQKAVENLEKKGLVTVESIKSDYKNILFRSHGIEKKYYDFAKENGINVIDATCKFVKNIHNIVEENYKDGRKIIIVGDKNHQEVIGINSYCNYSAIIIDNPDELDFVKFNKNDKFSLVFQTTYNIEKYEKTVSKLREKIHDLKVFNTICSATKTRQDDAIKMSSEVDIMIIIGDRSSSNSKKLYDIASKNVKSIFVEDLKDLKNISFEGIEKVGVTAGASTPDFLIREVVDYLNKINN